MRVSGVEEQTIVQEQPEIFRPSLPRLEQLKRHSECVIRDSAGAFKEQQGR